ncbi:MAG: hypothetical protein OXF06_14180 [Bacteroidetes bacterium]|nr:hypothetical protein [Bacteroidota bacterium]
MKRLTRIDLLILCAMSHQQTQNSHLFCSALLESLMVLILRGRERNSATSVRATSPRSSQL